MTVDGVAAVVGLEVTVVVLMGEVA